MRQEIAIDGTVADGFGGVADAFRRNFAQGDDVGASVALVVGGEVVVDLWGGHTSPERITPWTRDTITCVFSASKSAGSLCALLLADRGLLDLDAPVATYWPEFAANGKEHVLVRHVLSHTSGVSGFDDPIALEDLYDWDRTVGQIAQQAPWWEPGSSSGYHAFTHGFLSGELVRRVTGKPIAEFLAKELTGPLDADFQFGVHESDEPRVANIIPPPPLEMTTDLQFGEHSIRTFMNPPMSPYAALEDGWRRAVVPAANGHSNARGMARLFGALASGGRMEKIEVLSQSTIDRIFEPQSTPPDLVLLGHDGAPAQLQWGLGFAIRQLDSAIQGRSRRTCNGFGWGGSGFLLDADAGFCLAYAMNQMLEGTVGDARFSAMLDATYEGVS